MRGRGGRGGHSGRGGVRTPSGPWGRLKPVEQDPLKAFGLPSKGDTRLLDFKTQERYYTKIIERYMTFCSDAGERNELLRRFAALTTKDDNPSPSTSRSTPRRSVSNATPPSTSQFPNPNTKSSQPQSSNLPPSTLPSPNTSPNDTEALSDVMAALRKLREGIVASKRVDDFAVQAYLFCIRLSVLVKHPESYHPAILHVLRALHPIQSLTNVELQEVVGYLVLDAACRRADLAEAYSLRHRYALRDPRVDAVLSALAHDNYVAFRRAKGVVDGHKARLLDFADDEMRLHTLKCFGRTYFSVDVSYLEKWTGAEWAELRTSHGVGWEREGSKVVIRKVKDR